MFLGKNAFLLHITSPYTANGKLLTQTVDHALLSTLAKSSAGEHIINISQVRKSLTSLMWLGVQFAVKTLIIMMILVCFVS